MDSNSENKTAAALLGQCFSFVNKKPALDYFNQAITTLKTALNEQGLKLSDRFNKRKSDLVADICHDTLQEFPETVAKWTKGLNKKYGTKDFKFE